MTPKTLCGRTSYSKCLLDKPRYKLCQLSFEMYGLEKLRRMVLI